MYKVLFRLVYGKFYFMVAPPSGNLCRGGAAQINAEGTNYYLFTVFEVVCCDIDSRVEGLPSTLLSMVPSTLLSIVVTNY